MTQSRDPGRTTGTEKRPAQHLAGPVMQFNLTTELERLHSAPTWQRGDRNAITLVKEGDLRMTLTTLKTGARLDRHQVDGSSGLQMLAGRVRVVANGEPHELTAGDVFVMSRAVPHDLEVIEEATFLLTLAMPRAPIDHARPVTVLEAEHDAIRLVVGAMAVFAERLQLGQSVPKESLHDIVEFMRVFGDRCHHGKEEKVLFPLLEQKGVPIQGCPVGVPIHEHERGRVLVTQLEQAAGTYADGQADAGEQLRQSLDGLAALYPGHMWREEYLLFPMVKKILSPAEMESLEEQFERVEAEIGSGVHERLHELAHHLQAELGQSPSP